jgi:L-ornithine Nalpha-acyltransferase
MTSEHHAAAGNRPPESQDRQLFEGLTAGALELRLASGPDDIAAAQALRYRVFYEEMQARPSPECAALRRDIDPFDDICDHLLAIDTSRPPGADAVVATYRLLRGSIARKQGGFYTAGEYDIGCLFGYPGEMLELGRSCVDAAYRNRPTMQLLWRGIADYLSMHDISLLFGCASLPGTDAAEHALPLSYLYHFHLAPPALRPRALDKLYVDMNFQAADKIDQRAALAALPPLIKGYLRLGGFIGDGAVVDEQFNTVDVCIVVKTDLVTERYSRHYIRNGEG